MTFYRGALISHSRISTENRLPSRSVISTLSLFWKVCVQELHLCPLAWVSLLSSTCLCRPLIGIYGDTKTKGPCATIRNLQCSNREGTHANDFNNYWLFRTLGNAAFWIDDFLRYWNVQAKSADQTFSAPTTCTEETDKNKHGLWPPGVHSRVRSGRRMAGWGWLSPISIQSVTGCDWYLHRTL